MLASTAASLLVVLAVLKLWPTPSPEALHSDRVYLATAREMLELEAIQPTAQERRPPPPPRPFLPVVVPDATELDDVELDLTDQVPLQPPPDEPGPDATASVGDDAATSARSVEEGPRALRFVVPEYTPDARKRGIQATVQIEVEVDERGRVQQARILERVLLDDEGDVLRHVDELGYGLDQAVLSAARRWLFRPARRNGEPVASVTTIQLDVGDPRSNS